MSPLRSLPQILTLQSCSCSHSTLMEEWNWCRWKFRWFGERLCSWRLFPPCNIPDCRSVWDFRLYCSVLFLWGDDQSQVLFLPSWWYNEGIVEHQATLVVMIGVGTRFLSEGFDKSWGIAADSNRHNGRDDKHDDEDVAEWGRNHCTVLQWNSYCIPFTEGRICLASRYFLSLRWKDTISHGIKMAPICGICEVDNLIECRLLLRLGKVR